MNDQPTYYKPPETREELLQRYASGERNFPRTDVNDADLSGVKLDGASFESRSWFHDANFAGASLRGTSFRECNIKCASFRHADLVGALFELAAVEDTEFEGAKLAGVSFIGATCYGCTIQNRPVSAEIRATRPKEICFVPYSELLLSETKVRFC